MIAASVRRRRPGVPGLPGAFVLVGVLAGLLVACGDDDGQRLPPPAAPATAAPASPGATTTAAGGAGSGTAATSSSAPPTTAPATTTTAESLTTIQVRLVGGQPEGGLRRESVARGRQVRIEVTSDQAAEVHLHGYDETLDVEPGRTGALEITADVPGVFELETHGDGRLVLELEVR